MITCLGLAPALDITYGVSSAQLGGLHRPEWQLSLPGGKALNVARALSALGAASHSLVPVGGPTGTDLLNRLAAEGTGIGFEAIDTGVDTRRCITIVDESTGELTEIYEHAPPLPDAAWGELVERLRAVPDGWLAVSGSVPSHRVDSLAAELALLSDRGVSVALDVTREVLEAVLPLCGADLVKVNRLEATDAVGDAPVPELAERLRERGARTAVVTDGADGSVGADQHGHWRVRPSRGGIYTVGAGDSFLAGLLLRLTEGAPLDRALRTAAAIAAANTETPGAAVFDTTRIPPLEESVSVSRATGW
ncbi:PfkB family carbohydrate kinase [Herbiconiux sp. KACC 21604]|uniref:1-phosphofructokinase family hexose kinase n=1 Tax=unclassified Herbiconiux TaxID=2618217 RepID=UPI00149162C5|nr:PfkB family carbohydrate kinase [Herbiconiux sp. SALV-R1]QJU54772.1 hypothetical protein HL652_14845 [Herbiconiux sp. SALV-R1]WPO85881.1 PfkB family carbohydrate kinase [Herbiconiux sp. KACC 21604]